MKIYIKDAFSPMMMQQGTMKSIITQVPLECIRKIVEDQEVTSIIQLKNTASVISALVGKTFERGINCDVWNIVLEDKDMVLCVFPNYRVTHGKEFTEDDVRKAGYRCFIAEMRNEP